MRKIQYLVLLIAFLASLCIGAMKATDLVPYPQHVQMTGSTISASGQWTIVTAANPSFPVTAAADRIKAAFELHGLTTPVVSTSEPATHTIVMGTKANAPAGLVSAINSIVDKGDSLEDQGYSLGFDEASQKVYILGYDTVGVLYGSTTLEQLLEGNGVNATFAVAQVRDWPHFKRRTYNGVYRVNWGKSLGSGYQAQFREYINDYLVRNRINGLDMRHGGFTYHDEDYNDPANKQGWGDRLRWAVAEARKYGIEVQYKDFAACGWDYSNDYPYNEIIWAGKYFCYSRENLIRGVAGEMGAFLKDMGIKLAYIHEQDANLKPLATKWDRRCSECLKKWPDDDPNVTTTSDTVQWGEAQANLGNIYYDEIKKYVPDFTLNLVPTQYTGGWEPYQKTIHQHLDPGIRVTLRECNKTPMSQLREWHGNGSRGFFFYIEDQWRAAPMFSLRAVETKKYFSGNKSDTQYAKNCGGCDRLFWAFATYYAWNVNAPGADADHAFNPYADLLKVQNPSDPARIAFDAVAKHEFGEKWGPLAVETHLTYLLPGLYGGQPVTKIMDWIISWFPVGGDTLAMYWSQVEETNRMYNVACRIFAETDVPDKWPEFDMWLACSNIFMCYLMAEPTYWFERAKRTRAQDDYNMGYWITTARLAEYPTVLAKIRGLIQTRFDRREIPAQLDMYLQYFERFVDKGAKCFAASDDVLKIAKGESFDYKVRYLADGEINPAGSITLTYLEKPSWVIVKYDSLWGTAPAAVGDHEIVVVLEEGGNALDTLILQLKVMEQVGVVERHLSSIPSTMTLLCKGQKGNSLGFVVGVAQPGGFDLNLYNIVGQKLWSVSRINALPGLNLLWAPVALPGHVVFAVVTQGKQRITKRIVLVK